MTPPELDHFKPTSALLRSICWSLFGEIFALQAGPALGAARPADVWPLHQCAGKALHRHGGRLIDSAWILPEMRDIAEVRACRSSPEAGSGSLTMSISAP
jgi:hypothetical protein